MYCRILSFLWLFICLLIFDSCNVTEPDPYYNTETEKRVTGILYSSSFDTSTVYTTNHMATFRIDSVSTNIKNVYLQIDNGYVQPVTLNNKSFQLYIAPEQFDDGKHVCHLGIVVENRGLLSELNISSLTYEFCFNSYSGKKLPTGIAKIDTSGYPVVSWNPCPDMYFTSYQLQRIVGTDTSTIAALTGRSDTSFTDSNCPEIYGFNTISYRLITNSKYRTYKSTVKSINYIGGLQKLTFTKASNGCQFLLPCPDGKLIVGGDYTQMEHYDIYANQKYGGVSSADNCYRFNKQKTKILARNIYNEYCEFFDFNTTIANKHTVNYGISGSSSTLLGSTAVEAYSDVLFLLYAVNDGTSGETKWHTMLYDLNKEKMIKRDIIDSAYQQSCYPSPIDGCVYLRNNTNGAMSLLNVKDTAHITQTVIGSTGLFNSLRCTNAGEVVILSNKDVNVYDANLNLLRQLHLSKAPNQFYFNSNIAVVALPANSSGMQTIEIYNLTTLQLIRRIYLTFPYFNIILFDNNDIVFETSSDIYAYLSTYYKLK